MRFGRYFDGKTIKAELNLESPAERSGTKDQNRVVTMYSPCSYEDEPSYSNPGPKNGDQPYFTASFH